MEKKIVPYGEKHDVVVLRATPQMITVHATDNNEGYMLMGHGEPVLPAVGDKGVIEFRKGGPMAGYWKFTKS